LEQPSRNIVVDPQTAIAPDPLPDDFDLPTRARLAAHFSRHGLAFDPSTAITQLSGGLANRNYSTSVDGRKVVLRRPPDGPLPPGAHDMAREHMILSRLCRALPFIPEGLHLCEDTSVLGVPFQLIEFRHGAGIEGEDLSPLQGQADVPSRLCEMLVTTLAQLHAVDPAAVALGQIGRPEGFVARAIAGWAKRGAQIAAGTPGAARVEAIAEWLKRYPFRERPATLLHCDFKLNNILLDPVALKPVALIDWDMGTRGDPLFDLATLLSYWAEPTDPDVLKTLGQMPSTLPGFWGRREVAERYAALTSRPIDDLDGMYVLALLKLGVVFLQLHAQWLNGAVQDPHYETFGPRGQAMLEFAQSQTTRQRQTR